MKNFFYIAAGIAAVAVIGFGLATYLNRSAEQKAQIFCESIAIDSDISVAIQKFEATEGNSAHHFSTNEDKGQVFIFPGFIFDKAECGVYANKDGKVKSRKSHLLYD